MAAALQIDTQSNRVASHLSSMGVGPGDVVGVLLPRSAHLVVAMLGVLKCGAAYLPINEETPAERIKFMVEDTAAKVSNGWSRSHWSVMPHPCPGHSPQMAFTCPDQPS